MAPTASYSTLETIDDQSETQTIVVRLHRTWEARDFKRNNVLLSVECLLVDEKGNAIHASIHPRRLHKFRAKLIEGNLFSINSFDVRKNLNSYRLTDHEYKIFFSDDTSMDIVDGDQYKIPDEYFRIRAYKDIEKMAGKGENLPDIVAQVSCVRNSDKVDDTTTPHKITFNLILSCIFESGETAYVSIWDKLACKVRDDLEPLKEDSIVLIATGLNPKKVLGELYLNATASTRFQWNVENKVTTEFRKSTFFQNSLVPTWVDQNTELVPTDIQSISQILAYVNEQAKENEEERKEKFIWCKAKVVDVILSSGWFFVSCKTCYKKMTKIGQSLTCGVCGAVSAIGQLRYRIEVIVDDDCRTSTFIIFDEAAIKLLKSTASKLAAKYNVMENNDSGDIIPQEIQSLVGCDFIFYVKVAKYNFTAKYQSFSVSKMVTPPKRDHADESSLPASSQPKDDYLVDNPTSEGQEVKKRRYTRKNKAKVVHDPDEE